MVGFWVALVSFVAHAETTTAEPTPDDEVDLLDLEDEYGDFRSPSGTSGRMLGTNTSWSAGNGAVFTKLLDSEGKACKNEAAIFLHETFENAPTNSSMAVLLCADECTEYTNPNIPEMKCMGFELRDIASTVGLMGVECKLFSAKCDLGPVDDSIRGQYYLTGEAKWQIPMVPAIAAGAVALGVAGFLIMKPSYTYHTYDHAEAAEQGLLDDPSHELFQDDGSDYDEEGYYDE
jgi:hypothetical protein